MDHRDTLCSLKWDFPSVSLARHAIRACCRAPIRGREFSEEELAGLDKSTFFNNSYEKARRKEMLEGIRHFDCEHCWQLERKGLQSARGKLESPSELARWAEDPLESNRPSLLNLELPNLCDAKCVYCSRLFSTKWAAEDLEVGRDDRAAILADQPRRSAKFEQVFWDWFEEVSPSITAINIIGGEPLIQPTYYEILERLSVLFPEVGPGEKPRLSITTSTNLNTPSAHLDRFLSMLPSLCRRFQFTLDVSMEATGARAEYIREGVRWDRWVGNLNRLLEGRPHNLELGFQLTLNALCLSTLKEYLTLVRTLRDTHQVRCILRHNLVTTPQCLSPFVLTADFARYLYEAADFLRDDRDADWRGYGSFLRGLGDAVASGSSKPELRREFHALLSGLDTVRKRSFTQTFPEYREFWNLCRPPEEKRVESPLTSPDLATT